MDMRCLKIILGSFYLIYSTAYSQESFKKGFIVLSDGDTISGFINYKTFSSIPQNPTFIKFKIDTADKALIYRVADLSSFEITGSDIYSRANIYAEDIYDYEGEVRHVKSWMQTVWLRLIVQGDNVSLYRWNGRFYVQFYGDYLIELMHYGYDSPSYKEQLREISEHYKLADELSNIIEQCRFNSSDLNKIIVLLNKGKSRIFTPYPPIWIASYFVGMGIGVGSVDIYTFTNTPKIHFSNNSLPSISIGTDISSNFTTLFIRIGITLSRGNYKENIYKETVSAQIGSTKRQLYEFTQITISPGISIMNKFWDNGIFQIFGGGIINQNFSSYKKNFKTILLSGSGWEGEFDMKHSWLSFGLVLGSILNDRFEANITVQPSGKFSTRNDIVITSRIYCLNLRYHFK
jgi:hypothetical protein